LINQIANDTTDDDDDEPAGVAVGDAPVATAVARNAVTRWKNPIKGVPIELPMFTVTGGYDIVAVENNDRFSVIVIA
jgi:hypothetical protein